MCHRQCQIHRVHRPFFFSLNWSHRENVMEIVLIERTSQNWTGTSAFCCSSKTRSVPPGDGNMDYNINNGLLYPLRIVLFPVKWNNLHFAPNPIRESKSVPDFRMELEFKGSRSEVKRSLSEGHVNTVTVEDGLVSLKEWRHNKVCERHCLMWVVLIFVHLR